MKNLFDIKSISEINLKDDEIDFVFVLKSISDAKGFLNSENMSKMFPNILLIGRDSFGLHFVANNTYYSHDTTVFHSKTIAAIAAAHLIKNNANTHFLEDDSLMKYIETQSIKHDLPFSKTGFIYFCLRVINLIP